MTGGSCPVNWHYYNGNCFFVSTARSWQWTARTWFCRPMDAELASISDQAEMEFVESIS